MRFCLGLFVTLLWAGMFQSAQARHTQLSCLAEAVYHEARGASFVDKWGVARTVLNRTKHPGQFASTPCGVIAERKVVRVKHQLVKVVQFPWGVGFSSHHREPEAYAKAVRVAAMVMNTAPRGCEKDILFFGVPKASVGLPTRVCLRGKMTYRVPVKTTGCTRKKHHHHVVVV